MSPKFHEARRVAIDHGSALVVAVTLQGGGRSAGAKYHRVARLEMNLLHQLLRRFVELQRLRQRIVRLVATLNNCKAAVAWSIIRSSPRQPNASTARDRTG